MLFITFCKGQAHAAFLTTSTEGRSGYAANKLSVVAKTMRVMQLSAVFILGVCLQVAAAGNAQKITFSGRDVSLEKVLDQVKKQTNFKAVYDKDLVDKKRVTVYANSVPLEEFLSQLLEPLTMEFVIRNKTIFLRAKVKAADLSPRLLSPSLTAPPITVRGRVINEKGEPVMASIRIKGTGRGAITNENGYFELNNVEDNAILIVSGTNIGQQEIKVNGRSNITVNSITKIDAEEEVIINGGYYKTTNKTRTGNIARVDGADLEKQPVTSPLMGLQGRVPGLDILPTSGAPGSAPVIQIRGRNSLSPSGAYPLYVIDGVPVDSRPVASGSTSIYSDGFDPLSTINPANIESIEILKDADATSIYGSRGANGVILITTKKSSGNNRNFFDVTAYGGVGRVVSKMDLLNTNQYLDLRREGFKNDNITPTPMGAPDLFLWDTTKNTDWQKELLGKTAKISDAQLTFSGGNEFTSFRFGARAHSESSVFPGDFNYKLFSGSATIAHTTKNRRLNLSFTSIYGWNESKTFDDNSFVSIAVTLPPNAPDLYTQNGEINWAPDETGASTWDNPAALFRKTHKNNSNNLNVNANISYKIFDDLSVGANIGYSLLSGDELLKYPISAINPASVTGNTRGQNTIGSNDRSSWIFEPQATYSKIINGHHLSAIVGSTWQESKYLYRSIRASGYSSDILLGSLRGAANFSLASNENNTYKYTSAFFRLGYDWKSKYVVNVTGRRDGSSRFGPGNKFGNFGSLGAAWVFSEESFVKQLLPFVNFGKLRFSYGSSGNDQIGDYSFYNLYDIFFYNYQGGASFYPSALYNPDFQWEVTKKTELALELGLLNNKLRFEAAWFKNNSSNQLLDYQLPMITGFQSVLTNFDATIENKGWEFAVNAVPMQNRNFKWELNFNLSVPKNKLLKFDGIENSPYALRYQVGEPLTIQYLYSWEGVDPATGIHKFTDVDKNGMIDDADRILMKPLSRQYFGGINNSFSVKGFEISFLFQFVNQYARKYMAAMPGLRVNQPTEILNRWKKEGNISEVQRASVFPGAAYQMYGKLLDSDYAITKADFFRLKTLSISYSLPNSVIGKKIQSIQVFIQGQNLFTITDYAGLDPETRSDRLPPLKMVTAGILARF